MTGEPHAGERTWRNLLKADPSVDLVHFTILRPPEKQDGTPIDELSLIAFPTRELFAEKLDEFDLIIFDRYRRRGVLPLVYLANVADYVENGGALLDAAGPSFATSLSLYRTPLAAILPAQPTGDVVEQGFRIKLTRQGLRHPVTAGLGRRRGGRECGTELGALVPAHRHRRDLGHDAARRAGGKTRARPRSRGPRPRGAASVGSELAVGARLSKAAVRRLSFCAGSPIG